MLTIFQNQRLLSLKEDHKKAIFSSFKSMQKEIGNTYLVQDTKIDLLIKMRRVGSPKSDF